MTAAEALAAVEAAVEALEVAVRSEVIDGLGLAGIADVHCSVRPDGDAVDLLVYPPALPATLGFEVALHLTGEWSDDVGGRHSTPEAAILANARGCFGRDFVALIDHLRARGAR